MALRHALAASTSSHEALERVELWRENAPAEAVRLEFWYTADDLCHAVRTYVRQRLGRSHRNGSLCVVLIGFVLVGANSPIGWLLLAWVALAVLLAPRWMRQHARRQFANETRFHDRAFMQFDCDGLLMRNSCGYMVADWSYYHEAWESDEAFLLFFQTQLFHIVPKRVFGGPADRQRFREMVASRLPLRVV